MFIYWTAFSLYPKCLEQVEKVDRPGYDGFAGRCTGRAKSEVGIKKLFLFLKTLGPRCSAIRERYTGDQNYLCGALGSVQLARLSDRVNMPVYRSLTS